MAENLTQFDAEGRIHNALLIIEEFGSIDGAHHKQWVLDQVVRALTGTPQNYAEWVDDVRHPEGPNGIDLGWDEGIAP